MKGVEILKSRYKLILGYTGVILLGVSIAMLTPLLTIPFFSYKKLEIFAFIATAFFTAVIGFNLKRFVAKETNVTMSIQEGGYDYVYYLCNYSYGSWLWYEREYI